MSQLIYLFRHGQTDWNFQRRVQGHSDIPLSEKGREQALNLKNYCLQEGIVDRVKDGVLLSSSLARAIETAGIVFPDCKKVVTDELREANLGQAEGKTLTEVEEQYGELFWSLDRIDEPGFWEFSYPQGESRLSAVSRFSNCVEQYSARSPLAISAHGGILRLFIAYQLQQRGLSIGDIPIPNCALYQIELTSKLCTYQQLC